MDIQMVGILWLIGAFLLGLLNCFFGYRLFIVTVAISRSGLQPVVYNIIAEIEMQPFRV